MADLHKLYEKAEKYLQKQKFESAVEVYTEIHKLLPDDEKVLLLLGDLYLRLNRIADSLRFQSLLVDHYIKRNDIPKAVATCRKILKSAPQEAVILTKMAGLLEKSQKNAEALEAYREALKTHRAESATAAANDCLQHIIKLDPANLDAHVELGEMATRAGQVKTATAAFLRGAQLAQQGGKEDRWAELVERAHALDPANEAGCIAAAELFLKRARAGEAVALLEPIAKTKPDDLTILALLTNCYLQTQDFAKAEPLCWKVYHARPESIQLVLGLAERLLHAGQTDKAVDIVGKLKEPLFDQGNRAEFLRMMEKIYQADESNIHVLEMLTHLYDEINEEDGLQRSLARLFNLSVAAENYQKATDVLVRILDVEPYGEGNYDRLLNLEGHIDPNLYKSIQSRVHPPTDERKATVESSAQGAAAPADAEAFEDMLVEGEMYLHYQIAPKLAEMLAKINRLYPGAQETNSRLHDLYDAAGFTPTPAALTSPPPAAAPARPAAAPATQSLEELTKISEITANIYRESTPQGVMQVAVNELGRAIAATRVWGGLGTADRPPTLTVEYCSTSATPSDIQASIKLYGALMADAANGAGGWSIDNAAGFPLLRSVAADLQRLTIKSLLALPLMDRDEPTGLLVIEQCDRLRSWARGETLLFKAIVTQIVIAVNNTKLRRLVRSLSGSDEETGLLPRSSYLDCLVAEGARAKQLSQPLSVCLLEVENPTALVKKLGDTGVQNFMRHVSKQLQSNLRQNDVAIRYSPYCLAVVFPDTALPKGGLAVEKLRGVLAQIKLDGASSPAFCSAVCDVPLGPDFDIVDAVTEVINRLEASLDQAHKEGGKRPVLSKFQG